MPTCQRYINRKSAYTRLLEKFTAGKKLKERP